VFQTLVYVTPLAGIIALVYAFWRTQWINKQDAGTDRMKEIAGYIREGAMAFLSRMYRVLAIFVAVVAVLLGGIYFFQNAKIGELTGGKVAQSQMALVAVSFIIGALCSGLAGYFGMRVATAANVRTTNAARKGLAQALEVSFAGGAVMGMSVVGLSILGLGATLIVLSLVFGIDFNVTGKAAIIEQIVLVGPMLNVLTGFSLGASSIALFARVGGGIYTKAADVGADLVGKVEAGIPEDDPRNPAVIADNVGDNVGDVAGMGADLFESYIGSIIGSMVLGLAWAVDANSFGPVLLPLAIASAGILISIACTFIVRVSEDGNPGKALHTGTLSAMVLTAIATVVLIKLFLPEQITSLATGKTYQWWGTALAVIAGLVSGSAIGAVTEYYTSTDHSPVREIAEASEMGPAPNIISGLGLGMWSTGIPVGLICIATFTAYHFSGLYGIALAALGMLATTGIQLAVDAFGPIADNAGGIAEMSELPKEVRVRTDKLDATGNTTAAIGKGFAIASAALTALALFTAFQQQARLGKIDLLDPMVMIGLFIGTTMPFVFSAMTMKAVGRSANAMIVEVRRQFREIPGLLAGDPSAKADYARCVEISTDAAIKEMIPPGVLALAVALIAGFVSPYLLGGILAGVTASGVTMAIFMSNAGGAWDNAKKYIEGGAHGGKGSEAHKAAVTGDTVGDPFKDTSGPALNILLKLMSVVALVLAPVIAVDTVEQAVAMAEPAAIVAPAVPVAAPTAPADAAPVEAVVAPSDAAPAVAPSDAAPVVEPVVPSDAAPAVAPTEAAPAATP
jgi:K(+)-stimulated pyrophosphate-energized sodium pump